MSHLSSSDLRAVELAKEAAMFAYNEERKKTDAIEQRAFGLLQFAKVGLTVIVGIGSVISNASIQDTPFRECLILLLAIAAAYLCKLFYRGLQVVPLGTVFKTHQGFHVKPDEDDVYATQADANYLELLKKHVANIVIYFDHTASDNLERIYQCKCCFVNTIGFLIAFFSFFALSVMHLFEPNRTLVVPAHRVVGLVIIVLALSTDYLVELLRTRWLRREEAPNRY